jgi:molybdopterin converting factor small subunit
MRVEVRLTAHLKRYGPGGREVFWMDLGPGATVRNVVDRLGIEPGVQRVTLINGRPVDDNEGLQEGDLATFIVPMTGG